MKCVVASDGIVSGVGVGFPGVVDNGVVIGGGVNLPRFDNISITNVLSDLVKMPVVVDNDANMMALGESAYGNAIGYDDVIFITIGTGIGGAILVDKKILGGYRNRGGELGHTIIEKDGKSCACGAKGCFETYASTRALISQYKQKTSDDPLINGEIIVEHFLRGETAAIEVMNQHFDYMAIGICNLVNIFSPQLVILGGGISESGRFYALEIESRVKRMALPFTQHFMQIVSAALGNRAGLLGCAKKVFSMEE